MWNLITIDGYFEGEKKWDLSFHESVWGSELEEFSIEQLKTADMLVFGKTTYQGMAEYWTKADGEVADYMNNIHKVICSTTLENADWNNTVIARDAVVELRKLKEKGNGNIFVFGSGILSESLMKEGLFDEYRLCIAPVLLGKGRRLFNSGLDYRHLKLLETKSLSTGGVILRYAADKRIETTSNMKCVLVTGGTGFVGIHTILQLLQKGYRVKTTIRSFDRRDEVFGMLKNGGVTSFDYLEFVVADLTKDDNWDEAVKGCDFVLHVASPFPLYEPKNANELIIPARDGTLRVLKASEKANVKRVVLTSSFAAIGYSINSQNHVFTEEDWTDPNANIAAYVKSKTVAELAAWDYIKRSSMELTVINPVGIFGPVLGKNLSSSIKLIQQLMNGTFAIPPNSHFNVVDVRDVADIHIKAMTISEAKGQRFLAASKGSTSLLEVAQLLQQNKLLKKVAKPEPEAIKPGIVKVLSNEKAKRILGWKPRSSEETVLATAESLIRL